MTSLSAQFVAPEYREVHDLAERRKRIADLVSVDIVPRLAALHGVVHLSEHPTLQNVSDLARLVIGTDGRDATEYVQGLRNGGLTADTLFSELLEPAAQRLGELWERDEVDFVDVTLGVGRLQALLSLFNCTHEIAPSSDLRSVLMLTVPGEQHSFGIAMVERFLGAGGWSVSSGREATSGDLAELVRKDWFAVAGITLSERDNLDEAESAIRVIRKHSANPAIGVMVGGPVFSREPDLASAIGADGTATSAVGAVVLAQKLLDQALAESAEIDTLRQRSRTGA